MHGLVEAAHVDHLHPDAGIAFATAADGEALTRECFGGRVAWVPWRRPGFQLGLDIAAIKRDNPDAIGVILGGHGITAWGQTSDECEARSLEIIAQAQKFIDERGATRPFEAHGEGRDPGRAVPSAAATGRPDRRDHGQPDPRRGDHGRPKRAAAAGRGGVARHRVGGGRGARLGAAVCLHLLGHLVAGRP
jgi:rhamnose utilization protein RhaD (predicted bifunctional aldolase and dehydrogenase)